MNPGIRFTTTSSTISPLSHVMRYTLCWLMVGVAEPFGMTQLAPVTLWFTPGPVMVQEESTPLALQVMLLVCPFRTRSGEAVIEADGFAHRPPTTGHVAGVITLLPLTVMT